MLDASDTRGRHGKSSFILRADGVLLDIVQITVHVARFERDQVKFSVIGAILQRTSHAVIQGQHRHLR